ncbi:oligosaccharide flippase family protein [Fusicatenibacter saccharivorans]|uniref:lipopolysaccharide biosynthesis protein n=1 Tax=Fusicatenibacter saccharivorans TaxID=1150298 RepID=UPI00156F3928|nr:oligosaccharide flippase family protein [Fusicatenibacter saccharivorans]NSE01625.1 oligosaccharide flippase family protein [Fusicatenibacter saccharivorans]
MNKILKKYNDIPIAAKAALWFVFCNVLQKCVALITTPVFTRLMTPDQYGQFSIYNSWLQIFTIITTLRLNWGVFNKGMSKYKEDRDVYTVTMREYETFSVK